MKKFLLLLTLIGPLIASAQKLIKKPDIDKTTGDTTWKTSLDRIYNEGTFSAADMLECSIMRKKNSYGLFTFMSRSGNKRIHFSIQKRLTIKFTNNSTLVLEASRIGVDTTQAYDFPKKLDICWAIYRLTSADVSILKDNTITDIQIETSKGNLDYAIKEKNSDLIAKQLAIITAN